MTISHSFKQFAKCKIVKDPNFFFPEDLPGTKAAIAFCQWHRVGIERLDTRAVIAQLRHV